MSKLAKQGENGAIGEARTQSILLSRFWVLKRSADVDGADFLVQRQCDSLEELHTRAREIQIMGIVQSKYFEKSNRVEVHKNYVLDNDQPRKEFFCSLHTDDEQGDPVHYFFSANDIIKEFEKTNCGKYFWFALTKEREYKEYKSPKNQFVLDKIESGMNLAEGDANMRFIQDKFVKFSIPTKHYQENPDFKYDLVIVNNVRMATVTDMKNNASRALEARRDIFENQGDFYWGDDDIGCRFLAVSILAHHYNGSLEKNAPIDALCDLLQCMDRDSQHEIMSQTLRDLADRTTHQPNILQKLETEFPTDLDQGDIAYFEVVSKFNTKLTVRCMNNIESVVDIATYDKRLIHRLNTVTIFLPGIERNAEPIKKTLTIKLAVERDANSGKVLRILDVFVLQHSP